MRADRAAKIIIGAPEPRAIPAVLPDGRFHRRGISGDSVHACVRYRQMLWPDPAISCAASTNNPAMKTDSATLPSLLVVVWKDWPGCIGKAVQVQAVVPVGAADQRQAVRAQAVERVAAWLRCRCSYSGCFAAGLVVIRHRLVQDGPIAGFLEISG